MKQCSASNFEQWRDRARECLAAEISPHHVMWNEAKQDGLFSHEAFEINPILPPKQVAVSQQFLSLATEVSYHRNEAKWALLYRLLWRLTHGEKHVLNDSLDTDTTALRKMAKEVSRDGHKMKAFVRFRQVENEENSYIAWHEPTHLVMRRVAPFFSRRFAAMKWAILTPDESVFWNGEELKYGLGVTRDQAPAHDEMEELWKTFYRNIFNPARIKIGMMKSEMPMKYWHTMPETALIPHMLEEADKRIKKMMHDNKNKDDVT